MDKKRHTKRNVSRRDFVRSAAVAGFGVSAAAAGGRGTEAAAPRWDKAADVVVVGAGAAGLAAAIEAAQHGASVILIEQNVDVGGHAIQSGANMPLGGGTSLQKKYGIEDSPELYFADLVKNQDYRYNDRDLIRTITEWSAPTFEWLVANGVVFPDQAPRDAGGQQSARRSVTVQWDGGVSATSPTGANGTALVRPLEATARRLGVQILLRHSLTRVVREGSVSGRVLGVAATSQGRTVQIQGRKGLVIATGGHSSNVNFRRIFDPRLTEEYQVVGGPYSDQTGDGEIAAMLVGASLWGAGNQTFERGSTMDKPDLIGNQFGVLRPSNYRGSFEALTGSPIFDRIRALGLEVSDYQDLIHVNQVGLRFVNEAAAGYAWFNACLALNGGSSNGGGPIWAIFDAEGAAREKWTCAPPHVDPDGWFFSGSTLAELAGRIVNKYQKQPMPPRALVDTVAKYNGFVDAGKDADFGKPAPKYKIQTPPFYAAWSTPLVHDCLSGLRINTKSEVVDLYGQVIPGLYCGGESAGGFSQHGLMKCIIQGRIAGHEAASTKAKA